MLKMLIDNEEVVSNNSFTIKEEMLSASSTILNNTYPKTWEADHDYTSRFYYPKDYSKMVLTNETYYPHIDGTTIEGTNFQINADTTLEDEYYFKGNTTQNGTPTPTNPQPINVVTGEQDIYVYGKNLLNRETCLENKIFSWAGGTPGTENGDLGSDYIPVKVGNKYIQNYASQVMFYNKNKEYLGCLQSGGITIAKATGNYFTSFTVPNVNDIYYMRLGYRAGYGGTPSNMLDKSIMVNEGTTLLPYEPYIGNKYEVNLGKNLFNPETTYINNGSAITQIENGIRATLTTSGSYRYNALRIGGKELLGKTISLTGLMTASASNKPRIAITFGNSSIVAVSSIGTLDISGTSITRTIANEFPSNADRIYLLFYANTNGTGNVDDYAEYTNVQFELGIPTPYSPYFTPIELCKIGTYQDFIRKGTGSNLLDVSNYSSKLFCNIDSNGVITSNITNGYYCELNYTYLNDFLLENKGKTFTFSMPNGISGKFMSAILFGTRTGGSSYQEVSGYTGYNYVSFTIADDFTEITKLTLRFNRSSSSFTDTSTKVSCLQLVEGNSVLPYEPYGTNKWYLYKAIGKIILTGDNSEGWALATTYTNNVRYNSANIRLAKTTSLISNYFLEGTGGTDTTNIDTNGTTGQLMITISKTIASTATDFKTWLGTHNTIVYYQLETPTCTEITNEDLINQLESITLLNGLNNIAITSANLSAIMNLHYNYQTEHTTSDLIFSGIVKNTNNISLNPREPKYCSLEILDYKTLLSEGNTLDYVISNKTITEAITMVVNSVSSYGFELGNINILNGNDIIGAYSTENKTAYDVLQYLADISGAKWNCRRKDETTMYIDFYDPTLMPRGKQIEYTNQWAEENNLIDIKFNYGTRDYRNKQIIISDEVVGDIDYIENLVGDSVNTSFLLGNNVASITSIVVNGENQSVATETDKDIGIYADFYYKPGSNEITSNSVIPSGTIIKVTYKPVIKGREVITNDDEITRLSNQLEVNGIIARYESRNDETDSNKLLAIGETYLRYKGEAEITLTIQLKDNDLYNVGQMVYFNAPIQELARDYLVKSKQILYYVDGDTRNIFYTYTLSSSFNAEREVNWFDNQRNKTTGNIEEGDFISRNIDISSTANIIWDNLTITEINDITGNNELNATLNAPLNE